MATPLLILQGVRAIDPSVSLDDVVDIVVEGGRISRLGRDVARGISSADELRIQGDGRWVLPGLVEVHAHLREPGFEHKEDIESGLRAAAAGGYVHVCAMPNTRPVNDCAEVTRAMIARAKEVGGPKLHVIAAITQGLEGKLVTDMDALRSEGVVGFSDDGRCVVASDVMKAAMQRALDVDAPVIQHAEDHALTKGALMHEGTVSRELGVVPWPRAAEDVIVARDIILTETTPARYHVAHVSTEGAVRWIRLAKERGLPVTAEVTPHHLLLTHESLVDADPTYKVNPPLREERDIEALVAALIDGTIDCVATDHAPHSADEKGAGLSCAPPGMIGLEFCLPLMLTLVRERGLPLTRLVEALTTSPAKLIGIRPPTLREGASADFCLVDPDCTYVLDAQRLRSKSRNTPFLNRTLRGQVDLTVVAGQIAFHRF